MTREERARAREVLEKAAINSGEFAAIKFDNGRWNPWPIAVEAMLTYAAERADAEAAAMRERAAEVCATYPASRIAADLAAAIRSLPATGEVGRG